MPMVNLTFHHEVSIAKNEGGSQVDAPSNETNRKKGRAIAALSDVDQLLADCNILLDCFGKMARQTREIHRIALAYQKAKNTDDGRYLDAGEEGEALRKESDGLISNLDAILRIVSKRPPILDRSDKNIAEWDASAPLFRDIQVVVDGEAIYVKTPPLFNRNWHWSSRVKTDYYATFSPIVERKIQAIRSELPQFVKKNVTLIAVYPDGEYIIPDTDNLDGKTVVDAILNTLPGADCGDCCTFFSASIRSERLPRGAYFTVSEGFAQVPDFDKNIQKLENLFSHGK